ncbi:hypothetical protein C1Y63_12335, partial [Corynebacterium sp. 13CS0277]|uniref:HNH endonuclease signature motif containing protein n=1 Tax=Corynebacterium sp. 13CS0277 TaxID=2071994 RepID=UPI000D469057
GVQASDVIDAEPIFGPNLPATCRADIKAEQQLTDLNELNPNDPHTIATLHAHARTLGIEFDDTTPKETIAAEIQKKALTIATHAQRVLIESPTTTDIQLDEAVTAADDYNRFQPALQARHTQTMVWTKAHTTTGGSNVTDYLTHNGRMSTTEARRRIELGTTYYGTVRRSERPAQRHMRRLLNAGEIDRELTSVATKATKIFHKPRTKKADINITAITRDAMLLALSQPPEQVKNAVNNLCGRLIAQTGQCLSKTAYEKRYLNISEQDALGGVRVNMYLDAAAATEFIHLINRVRKQIAYEDAKGGRPDVRTPPQARADAFRRILRLVGDRVNPTQDGSCSLVVSVPASMIDSWPKHTNPRFITSAGTTISVEDLGTMLGESYPDFLSFHDPATGFPVALARTKRLASLHQRLMLFSHQAVCAHPGCTKAHGLLEAHHLKRWADGGRTDLDNLVMLCPKHHKLNEGMLGHHRRNPLSWRVAFVMGSEENYNDTREAGLSGGAHIRRSYRTLDGWEQEAVEAELQDYVIPPAPKNKPFYQELAEMVRDYDLEHGQWYVDEGAK